MTLDGLICFHNFVTNVTNMLAVILILPPINDKHFYKHLFKRTNICGNVFILFKFQQFVHVSNINSRLTGNDCSS